MREKDFVQKILLLGGKPYIVGGYVRDKLLGRKPKDKDYLVVGLDRETFTKMFPLAKEKHPNFPVFILELDGKEKEISLARREKKCERGYKGFQIEVDKSITLMEDLKRRDTTMNAMALSLPEKKLIDLFHGKDSIQKKEIRAISKKFAEDPRRALRAARQAGELSFAIEAKTLHLMQKCREEVKNEPAEIVLSEFIKALQGERPALFFEILDKSNLLDILFPELHELQGIKTKVGTNVLHTTLQFLDEVSKNTTDPKIRFTALSICLKSTPIDTFAHARVQNKSLLTWKKRMHLPKAWVAGAEFFASTHEKVYYLKNPKDIVRFILHMEKGVFSREAFILLLTCKERLLVKKDASKYPEAKKIPFFLQAYPLLLEKIKKVSVKKAPSSLAEKEIGEWLVEEQAKICEKFFAEKKR